MAATIKDTFKINSAIHNCFPVLSCIQRFKDDKIIITESVNLTLIYDLSKMFCVRSFTFTSLLPLSAPLVYDAASDRLVAIKNKTQIDLIRSESECDEVTASHKVDKSRAIRCVLAGQNSASLVVFESGRVCELDKLLQEEQPGDGQEAGGHQLRAPTKDVRLDRLAVVTSAINNLRFWAEFADERFGGRYYVLFNFNFILNELTTQTKIVIKNIELFKSISFSGDGLLAIDADHHLKMLTSRSAEGELIFDPVLRDGDELLDHGYLALRDNVSAIALLTYNRTESVNYLAVYDLNLKMEMKRIALPIESEHRQVRLNCLGSAIFAQTNSALIYVPVATEELALADLIASYKSDLKLTELNLTFEGIVKYLKGNSVKPIDREFLLVEALEQFILTHRAELELASISDQINSEIPTATNSETTGENGELDVARLADRLPVKLNRKLRQLFAFTFNSEFLIQQLKRKQFEREFLVKILDLLNKALNSQASCALVNVIDWISLVFDAYFICLNSANNPALVRHLNRIRTQTDQLILKSKNEKDLKCLLATLLLTNLESNLESNLADKPPEADGGTDSEAEPATRRHQKRPKGFRIVLPDHKHLGYKLAEIYL